MSVTVDQAFITQFESEVKLAYQQMGSKARNTVRLRTGVVGSTARFQKIATGAAAQKARHGKVPTMNAVHSYEDATPEDWYAGDWIDKLDLLKLNIDERQATAQTGAYALGRKVDSIIFTAARSGLGAGQKVAGGSAGLNKAKSLAAFELLNDADVPDDGQRFCAVGAHQWNELLNIAEFKSSDYVGDKYPWLAGTESKKWLATVWYLSTQLTVTSGTRYCIMYHKSAIGLAEGLGITSDFTWHGDYASWFMNNMLSAGAVRIEDTGVVEIPCDDDATIT